MAHLRPVESLASKARGRDFQFQNVRYDLVASAKSCLDGSFHGIGSFDWSPLRGLSRCWIAQCHCRLFGPSDARVSAPFIWDFLLVNVIVLRSGANRSVYLEQRPRRGLGGRLPRNATSGTPNSLRPWWFFFFFFWLFETNMIYNMSGAGIVKTWLD